MYTTINKHYTTSLQSTLYYILPNETKEIIDLIEHLVVTVLTGLKDKGNATLRILNKLKWENFIINNEGRMVINRNNGALKYECIQYKFARNKYRFCLILYILAEVHHNLLTQTTCSSRELYYKNRQLARKQCNTDAAIRDVCFLLNKPARVLGIFPAAKGLISGDVRIHIANGDVLDCSSRGECGTDSGTLLPQLVNAIVNIDTSAKCVLLVEKDTIFRKLLSLNILTLINCILLTGKGYPDINTRFLVRYLSNDCHLPVYALFDADPFGIEIMLIYRHGSRAMALSADYLACPQLQWLGVHPTELVMFNIPTLALQPTDYTRLRNLLKRDYIAYGVRHELECMLRLRSKVQIEAIIEFLVEDYIPNKIRRNLLI